MAKVQFKPKHEIMKCWACNGKGHNWDGLWLQKCKTCKGTGKFIEEHYHLIYTDKKGNKMAFGVDGIK